MVLHIGSYKRTWHLLLLFCFKGSPRWFLQENLASTFVILLNGSLHWFLQENLASTFVILFRWFSPFGRIRSLFLSVIILR